MMLLRPWFLTALLLNLIGCVAGLPANKNIAETNLAFMFLIQPHSIAYSKFLFATGAGDNTFRSLLIDDVTGAVTPVSAPAAPGSGIGAAAHPTQGMAYMAINGGNGVAAFSYNTTSGVMVAAGTSMPGGSNTHRISVMPDGSALYMNTIQPTNSVIWKVALTSTGALSTATSVDASEPTNSQFMLLSPNGLFLYGANNSTGGVTMFRTNNGGSLVNVGTVLMTGTEQIQRGGITSDSTALIGATNNGHVVSYAIDSTTGALTQKTYYALPGPNTFVLSPKDNFAYTVENGTPIVYIFAVNSDKSLTFLRTMNVGGNGYANACMDKGGRFLFMTKGANPGGVLTFKVQSDGSLVQVSSLTNYANNLNECATSYDTRTGYEY